MGKRWQRYEYLRPDQLREAVRAAPVLYWPLGLLEHHGWHLPVGYDGIKAERFCVRLAERTGGLLLPTMWWGAGGGHGDFAWTFYQAPEAAQRVLGGTLERGARMGFRVIVAVAGHYPWQGLVNQVLPGLERRFPELLFLAGNEMELGRKCGVEIRGDHAARWETTYGLALLPELVDMSALKAGRSGGDWPDPEKRPDPAAHPELILDPAHPLFAQLGEDPRRTASAEEGERRLTILADAMAAKIEAHLKG